MKYVFGPVYSWRLGSSLGVDLLSDKKKICTFGCAYCQLTEESSYSTERKIYVPTDKVISEIRHLPDTKIDFITFSGRGEPTLALNLGEVIREIRKIRREKIAVLTNSSLLNRDDVRLDLTSADLVACKLDAATERTFNTVNRNAKGITLADIVEGIKKFREGYKGQLALQIMFTSDNIKEAAQIKELAKQIEPYEIEINTPLRPPAYGALELSEIKELEILFSDFKRVVTVFDEPKQKVVPISEEDTLKRRGKEI